MQNYLYGLATDRDEGFLAAIFKVFLLILSFIYGLLIRSLIFLSRLKPYRLSCRVVSIGNITWGGTGKTSLAETIAKYLKQQGHKVAILSRGYKRLGSWFLVLGSWSNTEHRTPNTELMGDEPYMLQMKLKDVPILVDAQRIRAAKLAIRDYGVDTVILDDGFQQWKIKKDLELVTVDATDPFGNSHLIPRGSLREPLSSLSRADIFVLTKTNLNPDTQDIKDFLSAVNPRAEIFESIHSPSGFYPLGKEKQLLHKEILEGKTVTLVSGIASPDSFENLIKNLGINIGLLFRFPDHHNYTREELDKIMQASKDKNIDTIITTEKDAVRISPYLLPTTYYLLNFLVLRIELKIIKDEQKFYNRFTKLYSL